MLTGMTWRAQPGCLSTLSPAFIHFYSINPLFIHHSFNQSIIHSSFIHSSFTHHSSIIHSSFIHHLFTIHHSFTHHSFIIHSLSIHHSPIIHSSFIHHSFIIYAPLILPLLATQATFSRWFSKESRSFSCSSSILLALWHNVIKSEFTI